MPLNRDTFPADGQVLVNAEDFTTKRQQKRVNPERSSSHALPPGTSSQDDIKVLIHGRKGSIEKHEGAKISKQFALDADEPVSNGFKIPVSGFPPKHEKSNPQKVQVPIVRKSKNIEPQQEYQSQLPENGNVFDETRSLDLSSFTDADYEENQTVIQRLQARASQYGRGSSEHADNGNEGHARGVQAFSSIGKADPHYRDDKDVGREILKNREHTKELVSQYAFPDHHNKQIEMDRRSSVDSDSVLLETPSRSRSVPVQDHILAPVARRGVAIDSNPQFFSPMVRSEELARERTPDAEQSRPKSALSGTRGTALVQRTQQRQPLPHSQLRESQIAHPARFQAASSHDYSTHTCGQKVSAPGSDVPESSEDERPAQFEEKPNQNPVNSYTDQKLVHGRKRSREGVRELDYDQAELQTKSLADLQNEPFLQDPRGDSGPQTDGMGDRLSLSTVFEKWSKMSDDVLKGVFQSQTDDEWTQTGQWFVDSFQADLKELMDARLGRRKVALDFEHKIRKRQREVEHYGAGLAKELKELQDGGTGLLRDRKMTAGSRSNTPMKPTRPR